MISLNTSIWRKIKCFLGFHAWIVAGSWRQETKATLDGDWYIQKTWDDYLCRYCGKWERGLGNRETMAESYGRFWHRIQLRDIIRAGDHHE